MVRFRLVVVVSLYRCPHPRGDGPRSNPNSNKCDRLSPPAWGWSALRCVRECPERVVPTRVGMVRTPKPRLPLAPRCPHPRGDGPGGVTIKALCALLSPPAWGWSAPRGVRRAPQRVVPTRVGMVRLTSLTGSPRICCPHPRGDGPLCDEPAPGG